MAKCGRYKLYAFFIRLNFIKIIYAEDTGDSKLRKKEGCCVSRQNGKQEKGETGEPITKEVDQGRRNK